MQLRRYNYTGVQLRRSMAAGVPVVATRAGGVPEAVIHEQTGLLAEVGDVEQLAVHVMQVLEDTSLAESLVHDARQNLENFTKEAMVLGVYSELR